jgi:hypothetical protein
LARRQNAGPTGRRYLCSRSSLGVAGAATDARRKGAIVFRWIISLGLVFCALLGVAAGALLFLRAGTLDEESNRAIAFMEEERAQLAEPLPADATADQRLARERRTESALLAMEADLEASRQYADDRDLARTLGATSFGFALLALFGAVAVMLVGRRNSTEHAELEDPLAAA